MKGRNITLSLKFFTDNLSNFFFFSGNLCRKCGFQTFTQRGKGGRIKIKEGDLVKTVELCPKQVSKFWVDDPDAWMRSENDINQWRSFVCLVWGISHVKRSTSTSHHSSSQQNAEAKGLEKSKLADSSALVEWNSEKNEEEVEAVSSLHSFIADSNTVETLNMYESFRQKDTHCYPCIHSNSTPTPAGNAPINAQT